MPLFLPPLSDNTLRLMKSFFISFFILIIEASIVWVLHYGVGCMLLHCTYKLQPSEYN
jgi:uncharacterized membrane protein YbhN (UPF0104 family)